MTLLAAWFVYPLVLAALCAGTGLLVDLLCGRRLPGALLLPVGFAAIIVVGVFTTATGPTAALTVPLIVALAATGGGLSLLDWRFGHPDPWATGAAVAVFLVFGAPVLFSGEPTFAGYIKLDDTSTWLAITDWIMEHGRSLDGLELSTYRATLEANLSGGYPVGVFVPFGTAQRLTGGDLAWVFQPYLSLMATLLSLTLWQLFESLRRPPAWRAAAAFVAAQPALLYGYAMWGGVKELATATLVALAAALAPAVLRENARIRELLALAIVAGALVGVLSVGGIVWAAPMLLIVAGLGLRSLGTRETVRRALAFGVSVALLSIPTVFGGGFSPFQSGLTKESEIGNLVTPLNLLQALGVWPNGDFRYGPDATVLSVVLIGLGLFAAAIGLWWAISRRRLSLLLFATAIVAALAVISVGSPWVDAKALVIVAPAVLSLAVAGAVFAIRLDYVAGVILGLAVAFGVLWSNALAYHDVSLAPYAQLRELERIGEEYAGDGPALMTEYQPYGVRHFLRDLDAEGASELRFRPVTLVDGSTLEKGEWADTDRIALDALLTYRTLVLRRSPAQSRPPSVYSLVRAGDYYDVWQRPLGTARPIAEHLPLGDFDDPGAYPSCGEVRRLAELAGPGGTIAAVPRGPNAVSPLLQRVRVPRAGSYDVYALGGVRNRVTALIDGDEVGSVAMQLNQARQFVHFGRARLSTGEHRVQLLEDGPSLAPGTGAPLPPLGPLVLSPDDAASPRVLRVPASRAEQLCGQRLDWLEALPPR